MTAIPTPGSQLLHFNADKDSVGEDDLRHGDSERDKVALNTPGPQELRQRILD